MLFWHWLDWSKINPGNSSGNPGTQTYPYNLYAYNLITGVGKVSASTLLTKLKEVTAALSNKMSASTCLARALQRAPDPLFFDADLYGAAPNNSYTLYYNVDLMNAMATVLAMLSKGVSTRAIISELLVQANVLAQDNALNQGIGNPANVSPGYRALLDDYIALAAAEDHDKNATMASVIAACPAGFAGRTPSAQPNPIGVRPGMSTVQKFVNIYDRGH